MSYTTEELIEILDQELRANWQGKRVLFSSSERLNNPVLAKAIGTEKLSKIFAYRDFRAQIHEYQRQHKVSGLVWRTYYFNGYEVACPELHNQLIAIPEDKETLIRIKPQILEFWQQATKNLFLWQEGTPPIEIDPETVNHRATEAEWLEVETTQTDLILNLCWGNPKECHYQWANPNSGRDRVIATFQKSSPFLH
ncbi:hypothetical protein FRE64_01165 [Euhalothece natronophila Z-M001]|uniref:Uncharacterized protein n=1 Tax=Euhalothece natronophila Z-M001 TaxID=522448 RepID=A0A5B8NHI0_9CHRO|nr:hypothetical protein [Euhalothece natronophila]QDZ38673.1 hypothetical protein FRE64_01165 [Euhalothece natronophila Z-M001]